MAQGHQDSKLGKDIDEDLTGDVPQLRVGMHTFEQRLPQWLRRVSPQVPSDPGPWKHSSAHRFLLQGPVREGGCWEDLLTSASCPLPLYPFTT